MDQTRVATRDLFGNGGAMGELMRGHDWASTPIGAPDSWPQSLRTTIRVLLGTRHPMFIWWGPSLIQFYNDAYSEIMGTERHPYVLGRPGKECWEEIWDVIGPEIDHVMQGKGSTWHESVLIPITRNGNREEVWWTYGYSPIDDSSAPLGVGGVLVICNDVTAQHRALEAVKAGEERLRLAVSAGTIGTWDWNVETDELVADDGFARAFGGGAFGEIKGAGVEQFLHSVHTADRDRLSASIRSAMENGDAFSEEYRIICPDGSIRWVSARGICHRNELAKPTRFVGAATDITERKQGEMHRQMLTAEMDHRVKNILARVQAIVNQSLKTGVDVTDGRNKIVARIGALSKAQDMLTGKELAGLDLEAVVRSVAEPFSEGVFSISGPPIGLSARTAQSFMLAFHELATNAVKYGSLSRPEGRVSVEWRVTGGAGDQSFELQWTEMNGPEVKQPERTGFGTRLINKLLSAELKAKAAIDYSLTGLIWHITAPLKNLSEDDS